MGLTRFSGLSVGHGLNYYLASGLAPGGGIVGALNANTLAYNAAVVAAGGSITPGRLLIINNFIASEMQAGTWALTDDYWLLAAESTTQALISLKQRRTASAVNSPTFVVDRGYTGNGSNNYVDTGFIPGTHAISMSATNARLASYELTNVAVAGSSAGTRTNAANVISLVTRSAANQYTVGVVSDVQGSGTVTDSRGFTSVRRNDSASQVFRVYKSGVSALNVNTLTPGPSLPSFSLYILARNNNGTPGSLGARSVAFVCIGASFSDQQELSQYMNVTVWATAIGANV